MTTIPVYVFAKWQVKQGSLEKVLSLLEEAARRSREEKGNLVYKLHQSNSDPNTILLYEGYADEAAAREHRDSDYFQEIVISSIVPLLETREVFVATSILDQ
ncbi:putative quinol monooxygenase [Flavihumibacter solisilvae]|uniref:Antibiotic biosynthesis monooxygenase n=1 Tax=Flavihumibacter solisilvae TaxID=1349421 RepID=A0A0C1IY80_9BACT|nr:putative quinol monooxygenase [Flavihumibacter solisilvae]KIC95449.1 antibiotic biosynthesis monooxygenase [Flavihumibacter solisilvae]